MQRRDQWQCRCNFRKYIQSPRYRSLSPRCRDDFTHKRSARVWNLYYHCMRRTAECCYPAEVTIGYSPRETGMYHSDFRISKLTPSYAFQYILELSKGHRSTVHASCVSVLILSWHMYWNEQQYTRRESLCTSISSTVRSLSPFAACYTQDLNSTQRSAYIFSKFPFIYCEYVSNWYRFSDK